jgi:CRP-like cAMP-binding protein
MISKNQSSTLKMLQSEITLRKSGLFSAHDLDIQIKYFSDNMDLNVYLRDDIIIKQGDLGGDQEYVYFITEGIAEVFLEKRDFLYFNQSSLNFFRN